MSTGRGEAPLTGEVVPELSRPGLAAGARFLDHVGIVVRDADVEAARFRETLGLEVEHDETLPSIGVRLVYLATVERTVPASLFRSSVQLVQPIAPGPVADHLEDHGEGLHHVCFAVTDLSTTLESVGLEQVDTFLGGKRKRACFLEQRVAGTLVELIEVPVTERSKEAGR